MRWATVLLALGIVLAGCSDTSDTTTSSTTSKASSRSAAGGDGTSGAPVQGSSTTTSGAPPADGNGTDAGNQAPTATLEANVTSGSIPLDVSFTLAGSDPEGDAITAQLKVGAADPVPVTVPGSHRHTFEAVGNYTIILTVSDGNATATDELVIEAKAAAAAAVDPHCHRTPTEEAEGLYLFEGDGGTWVFLEDNGIAGLQVENNHPTGKDAGSYNPAWEGCTDGDQMVF